MNAKNVLPILILVLAYSHTANSDEHAERGALRDQSSNAFLASDFEKLEMLGDLYLTSKARTESGTWKLVWFHRGIDRLTDHVKKDDEKKWSDHLSKLDRWAEAYPDSPTPVIAHAAALIKRGWLFRGGEYAHKVAPEDMEIFHQYLSEARSHLVTNMETASRDPFWYVKMSSISRAHGIEKADFLRLIDQGIEEHPDFDELYLTTAGFLNPKWRGSREEINAFAEKARLADYGGRGKEMYTRIYWAADKEQSGAYLMHVPPADWELVLQGMDEILAKFPSQWNINKFAFFACYKQDVLSAKKYMRMIVEPIVVRAWLSQASFDNCQRYLAQYPD